MSEIDNGSKMAEQGAVEIASRPPWSVYAIPHGRDVERVYAVVDHSRGVSFRLTHTGAHFRAGGELSGFESRHPAVAVDVLRLADDHARHADLLGGAWHPGLSDWMLPDPMGAERFGVVIRPKVARWSRPRK